MWNKVGWLLVAVITQVNCYSQLLTSPKTASCNPSDVVTLLNPNANKAYWSSTGLNIANPDAASVRVTLRRPADYLFKLKNKTDQGVIEQQTVKLVDIRDLPIAIMARSLVPRLLTQQYEFLNLSHSLRASNNYYPNVAKFFRAYASGSAETLDKVVTYILAKHVTTAELDGSNPPNYSCFLFNRTFSGLQQNINGGIERPSDLHQAFHTAFSLERDIARMLTNILHHAQDVEDFELIEFVANDLLAKVTKSMKTLSNYKKSVKKITKGNSKGLGQFIFDKLFN